MLKKVNNLYRRLYLWSRTVRFSFSISYILSRCLNFIVKIFACHKKVPEYQSVESLNIFLKNLKWSEDSFRLFGIKISHNWIKSPEMIQGSIESGNITQMDCDEFATYAEAALKTVPGMAVFEPKMLTVRWIDIDGKISGHNVAFFSYLPEAKDQLSLIEYAHIGNWGLFKNFKSIEEMAASIAIEANGTLAAYAVVSSLVMESHKICKKNIALYLKGLNDGRPKEK